MYTDEIEFLSSQKDLMYLYVGLLVSEIQPLNNMYHSTAISNLFYMIFPLYVCRGNNTFVHKLESKSRNKRVNDMLIHKLASKSRNESLVYQ